VGLLLLVHLDTMTALLAHAFTSHRLPIPAPHGLLRRLFVAVTRTSTLGDSLPPNISFQKSSNAYSFLTA
jgi:hypothetical protein